ncbi:MAG: hypothetical protein O9272_10000, partial [Brevundimonas sp.]|nr:hypothetical protein [Brevundimonas sp.]
MNRIIFAALTGPALAISTGAALANPAVALDSAVYVERVTPAAGRMLEPANELSRGDHIDHAVATAQFVGRFQHPAGCRRDPLDIDCTVQRNRRIGQRSAGGYR